MTFVELRSDTFTLPTPRMIEAMATAELGDDTYGEDPTVNELERQVADLLGKEAACLVPSGTMGNLASILAHCARGTKAIVGDQSDIYVYEAGGASVCGGVVYHPIANQPDGTLALEDIEAAFPANPADPQFALPSLLCLENPQNRCGGRPLGLDYLADVSALAADRGIPVHLDGARIFNAAIAMGVPASRIARYADSVQMCLSKGLGAPVGSMVAGSGAFVANVRRIRKMLGGGMRQAGVLAAAGLVALADMADRITEDHENARLLAEGLARIPGYAVDPVAPRTNMVFFALTGPGLGIPSFTQAARDKGVLLAGLAPDRVRLATHSGFTKSEVDTTLAALRAIAEQAAAAA
ncbi:low-specificity L-threonine aldolase [Amycolatopsis sp. cmx-11-12]|uniref:low-specificity L-threonine aldolase n=1 Tax=Amycolatopsis sp. cmx-11-12 TaxID=2785795 RepID=UPI003916D43F